VKEDDVYPDLDTDLAGLNTYYLSHWGAQLGGYDLTDGANRTLRFYCRKLTDVRYTASVGKQALTYDVTDKYEHVFILDIRNQPPEGSVLLCVRLNYQLFCFGCESRHDGAGGGVSA
jgi:hypothetical protein